MQDRIAEIFHNGQGEAPDHHAQRVLRLAFVGVSNADTFRKKHQRFIGTTAVVATSAYLVASFAINNLLRARPTSTDEEIISGLTDQHLDAAEKEFSEASKLTRAKRTIQRAAGSLIHSH